RLPFLRPAVEPRLPLLRPALRRRLPGPTPPPRPPPAPAPAVRRAEGSLEPPSVATPARSAAGAARRDGDSRPTGREANLIDVTRFTPVTAGTRRLNGCIASIPQRMGGLHLLAELALANPLHHRGVAVVEEAARLLVELGDGGEILGIELKVEHIEVLNHALTVHRLRYG